MSTAEPGIWYFAHPYTVRTPDGRYSLAGEEANFRLCCYRAAKLILAGWNIYAPICHTHPIHMAHPDLVGKEVHDLWYCLDNALIDHANFTGIILAPLWEDSAGCCGEMERFNDLERQIRYLTAVDPAAVVRTRPLMSKAERIRRTKEAIQYEREPGIHTFHVCPHCREESTRSGKCAKCLTKELAAMEKCGVQKRR